MKENKRERGYVEELVSTGTLALAGAYISRLFPDEFFGHLRESVKSMRHAGKTVYDGASGGPEGMRSVENLEGALEMVGIAAEGNANARKSLREYVETRQELVSELATVYRENETLVREAERLWTQLQGGMKKLFDAGNSLKPEFMKGIDNFIIGIYGQRTDEASAKSVRLGEFYERVNEFYDSMEKGEHTVKKFCDYLRIVKEESIARNLELNELSPSVIRQVKEGYKTEDIVLDSGEKNLAGLRTGVSNEELRRAENRVEEYGETVDETETRILQKVPIAPYKKPSWIEYGINPVTVGIAGALIVKGATKILPEFIERPIRKILALPFTLASDGVILAGRGIYCGIKSGKERIKKFNRQRKPGDNENGNERSS